MNIHTIVFDRRANPVYYARRMRSHDTQNAPFIQQKTWEQPSVLVHVEGGSNKQTGWLTTYIQRHCSGRKSPFYRIDSNNAFISFIFNRFGFVSTYHDSSVYASHIPRHETMIFLARKLIVQTKCCLSVDSSQCKQYRAAITRAHTRIPSKETRYHGIVIAADET